MGNRRFGFECELTSGSRPVIAALHAAGLAGMDDLHGYHCRCNYCQHNDVEADGGFLFRAQNDCTVDGEIISSILTHGTESAERAFGSLATVLLKTRAEVDENAGFHVHVDKTDLNDLDRLRLFRMYLRYQHDGLSELASATASDVRDYNRPVQGENEFVRNRRGGPEYTYASNGVTLWRAIRPHDFRNCNGTLPPEVCCRYCTDDVRNGHVERITVAQAEWDAFYGPGATPAGPALSPEDRFWNDDTLVPLDTDKSRWLHSHGAGSGEHTMEFRLWNATRVEWRMRLAVGVSVAMVDAAKAGVNVTKDDSRCLEEVVGDYLSDDTWAAILRQRSFKDVA